MDNSYKGTGAAERKLKAAAEKAVRQAAADLQGRAVRDAPVDTGDLRGSGHATDPVWVGNKVVARVEFDLPYAKRQHEETEWEHPKGGKAKYLSDNVDEMRPKYIAYIQSKIARYL